MVTVLDKGLCESIGSSDTCLGPAYHKQDILRSGDRRFETPLWVVDRQKIRSRRQEFLSLS